jgi:pantoate--beta-alanine ligase
MKVIRTTKALQNILKGYKRQNRRIGFVPTMGALHAGHMSLIHQARKENDIVVVSIFVNPTQFGPREDFERYPRSISHDMGCCRKENVDFLFMPTRQEMYPKEYSTFVSVDNLSAVLCGKNRPGHFKGVATIVAKLFNIVAPDNAYFGQKDAQQAVIIRKLIDDLNFPIKISVVPTVREADGLALSSRNTYLNEKERKEAVVLIRALELGNAMIKSGVKDSALIVRRMRSHIKQCKSARIDYVALVGFQNLRPLTKVIRPCLLAVAVWIGKTRLIDNKIIQ